MLQTRGPDMEASRKWMQSNSGVPAMLTAEQVGSCGIFHQQLALDHTCVSARQCTAPWCCRAVAARANSHPFLPPIIQSRR